MTSYSWSSVTSAQSSVDTSITKRPGELVLSSFVFLDTTGSGGASEGRKRLVVLALPKL